MLILSLTGNRIRGTPILSCYIIIHTFSILVNNFFAFYKIFLVLAKKDGLKKTVFFSFSSYHVRVESYFLHVAGANNKSIGISSNLPASISKMNTIFAHQE